MKKLVTVSVFCAVAFVLTGCTAVKGYSLRSYQGPVPLRDYQYVQAESYGAPVAPRQ